MVSSWCVRCLGDDGIHIKYLNQEWHLGWYRHGLYRYQNGIYINININHMMIRVSGRPLSSPQGTVPTERMSRLSARRRQPGGSGNPPWQCGSFSHDSHVDGEFFHGRVWFNPEAYRYGISDGASISRPLNFVDTDMGHQDGIPLFVRWPREKDINALQILADAVRYVTSRACALSDLGSTGGSSSWLHHLHDQLTMSTKKLHRNFEMQMRWFKTKIHLT